MRNPNLTPEQQEESDRCNLIADQITYSFSQKMKKEYGLEAVGFGGGGDGKKINMRSVSFYSYDYADISYARNLLVACVEGFLKEINATEELKPCVALWPFTFENIKIGILFSDKKRLGEFVQSPFIAAAHAFQGKLDYNIYQNERLEEIKEETYEEALSILGQK